jgi:hypothetical protein
MQSDPDRERHGQPRLQPPGRGDHVERELRRDAPMAETRRRDAGDRHVVVADRLDLFDPDILGKPVKFIEQVIQAPDKFHRPSSAP